MSETKFTPGPWEIGELTDPRDGTKHVAINAAGATRGAVCLISSVGRFDATDARNALLITAAPDLLAACKAALGLEEQAGYGGRPIHALLRAAIARAEGVTRP